MRNKKANISEAALHFRGVWLLRKITREDNVLFQSYRYMNSYRHRFLGRAAQSSSEFSLDLINDPYKS